ncbi:GNAT family N-acetyltransferase [Aureibacter tunicatorum]|uniref:GNAT superfamily N-acetyltransferase n=1 Tax=Aureibacter tunicatorum TaxID=866807 RepID=A0AAE4BPD6_9BACT|nr:GNAT family N-acetyltransferase [Aureibacter tunicatorum]MDR6237864.1 GNAT superfamily N-acetyltransferase [Aureibacter tunicatorum]BDD02899.1 hypothetical protein AUTU_03820 [Aureibacter tunicatorum]
MDYNIRKINDKELVEAQTIARRTIRHSYTAFFSEETINMFIDSGAADEEFVKHFEHCYVLANEKEILGFCIFYENFIDLMMIDSNIHGKGLGTTLLQFAESKIAEEGYERMRLETFLENKQAVSFYLKSGWSIIKSQKEEGLNLERITLEKSTV